MAGSVLKLLLVGSGSLLCACDRLDTLVVIDSPDGSAVIIDNVTPSGDRVICIRSEVTEECSRRTAEVVVRGVGTSNDVQPGWADANRVTMNVARDKLERSAPSALEGRVSIEYR